MNKITFPLSRRTQGASVLDLQNALLALLERQSLLASDEPIRRELTGVLRGEASVPTYGDATTRVVATFQRERRLPPSGEVDGPTADAINKLLRELGLLDAERPTPRLVAGVLRREDGRALSGARIVAVHVADRASIRLGGDVTGADGAFTIRYEPLPGSDAINLRVSAIDENGREIVSSDVVANARPVETIDLKVPVVAPSAVPQSLEGAVYLEHGLPADKLTLRLYRREFGGKASRLDETTTVADGHYAFSYDDANRASSLEVRAVQTEAGGRETEVALSKPLNDLTADERRHLNLIAPGSLQPIASEYLRLASDLKPHVGNLSSLAAANEDRNQQDLSVLNRATGWDARLIAVAAIAERLKSDADVNLSSDVLYGLLRAGLPSDKLLLAQVEPDVVEMALQKASTTGVIAIDAAGIAAAKASFTTFAAKTRLSMRVPGSGSTYGELLEKSGLPKAVQDKFAPVYLKHRGDAARLWEEAAKAGVDGTHVAKLQLQGKMAFLAGNAEKVTTRLLDKNVKDPVELVGLNLHSAAAWKSEVLDAAGIPSGRRTSLTAEDQKAINAIIPTSYSGDKAESRLEAYAEDMARKVRLSYPTQTLAHLIETDKNFSMPAGNEATVTLLKNASDQGFRLGETPVAAFLQARPSALDGLGVEAAAATNQLKTLQRVYQITPTNEAIPVLLSLGMTSAFDVMAYPEAQFLEYFKAKYVEIYKVPAPSGVPELVSRKAKQVSSVMYNLFAIARKLDTEPPVAGMSAPLAVRESVKTELIKHYPSMESLFGSMDYCECEHCRSVLSPAAYLVDLLQFVDTEPGLWGNFLAHWKTTHGGTDYPHRNSAGEAMKPYDVLVERRPDLPHITLSCENTHTALPYIDIVNEILEYYVANGKLAKEAARDTGDATTAELLAEPQYVIREAYDTLRDAKYPLALPFDLCIDTARRFCEYFETPFHAVIDALRPYEVPASPVPIDARAPIFIESLGLGTAEADVFTDPDPLTGDKWHALYGYPSLRTTIHGRTNVDNATVNVANAEGEKLRVGVACSFVDLSANAVSTEAKVISAVGAANSGGAGRRTVTFDGKWTTPPDAGDLLVCDVPALFKSAKALSRRLGVTYKEIVDLVQTGFVNPHLSPLPLLYKLEINIRDARLYKDEKTFYDANKDLRGKDRATLPAADQLRFDALASPRPNRGLTGWDVVNEIAAVEDRLTAFAATFTPALNVADLRTAINAMPFDRMLVLADPDAGCNFDLTTLQYADGKKADAIVFLRINLFVRLWRKLGWTIEETDRALCTFVPASAPFDGTPANLAKQPLKTALVHLAHLKALDEQVKVGKPSRVKLLTLWSDIGTTGKKPLYAQLFLKRSVLKSSPVFDHPLGQFLADPTVTLKDHLLALQGALGLTADDIVRIVADVGESMDTMPLSLPNVSRLYRYGLFAKALKLSVRELISLKRTSGLNPFAALHQDPLATLDHDNPFSQTLEFVKIAGELKDIGLKVDDLEYLVLHRFEDASGYGVTRDSAMAVLRALSDGVRGIRTEHAVPGDPTAVSDEALRQKLGLALGPDVVDRFMAMVNTSAELRAVVGGVSLVNALVPATFAAESRIRQVSYKEVPNGEQSLTVRGVVFDPVKAAMKAAFDPALSASQKQAFSDLLDRLERDAREFFANQLGKQRLRVAGEAGFLEDADFETLFKPLEAPLVVLPADSAAEVDSKQRENEAIQKRNDEEAQKRRNLIASRFLPFLQQRLTRQLVVQTMAAHTGADAALVAGLVTDERLISAPKPLVDVFAATATRGIDVTFWPSADATGAPFPVVSVPDADTSLKDALGNPVKPAGADSARLDAFIEVPATGAYRFYIELDKQNARAELRFADLPEPVLLKGTAAANNATLGSGALEYVELKAGVPYRLSLDLTHLNGGHVRLRVQGETLPKGPLSQLTIYPAVAINAAERAMILLSKALQVIQSVGVSEREVRYLLTHASDFDGLSLSELPTSRVGDSPAEQANAVLRFGRLRRLVAYAGIKRDVAGGTDDLIGIFEANGTTAADRLQTQVYPQIARLTRRDEATVKAIAEALAQGGPAPAFASERPLSRLWEALQIVERFGVPPASLRAWAELAAAGTTGARRFELTRDVKEAIKARFEAEAWQRVAQAVFDALRPRQRDALVSYVMHQLGLERIEQLYEYFLVDPGMEPMVQTSRIRLAIASLQLFVQKCLLNLEPKVHPSTINARQWEWMKRFRVWEANRKIFLFPENWLEPEFRDDKTHLFAELEGALLQGDVSSDLVEDAFLNYLRKLDELARLDICAMHIEDNVDPALRILHVFGRTYSQPHKYFYRRYAQQMWTPWEPVSAEIEGDHLAPVAWRDRLYLFWVTFMDQADAGATVSAASAEKKLTDLKLAETMTELKGMVATKRIEASLHWSEYLNGEWTTRESGGVGVVLSATVPLTYNRNEIFVHVSKEYDPTDGMELGVFVHLGGKIGRAFHVAGRNSSPASATYGDKPSNPFSSAVENANRYSGSGALKVTFQEKITTEPGKTPAPANPEILKMGGQFTLLPCNNKLTALGLSEDAFEHASNPQAVKAALQSGLAEIAALVKPVFYQDHRHTLFIEPDVTERTIEEWQEWVTKTPAPDEEWTLPDWWKDVVVIPEIPKLWPGPVPDDPWKVSIDPRSKILPKLDRDWLVNPVSVVKFGDVLIGQAGQPGIELSTVTDQVHDGRQINVRPGSDVGAGTIVSVRDETSFAASGLRADLGGLNVVGGAGLTSALEKNLTDVRNVGFGAGGSFVGRVER